MPNLLNLTHTTVGQAASRARISAENEMPKADSLLRKQQKQPDLAHRTSNLQSSCGELICGPPAYFGHSKACVAGPSLSQNESRELLARCFALHVWSALQSCKCVK